MTAEFRRPRAHALWTRPSPDEGGAPFSRIVGTYHAGLGTAANARVGIQPARGYRKCGSRDETDWIRDVNLYGWQGDVWQPLAELRDLTRGTSGVTEWLGIEARGITGVLIEVRRSWIDGWWPSWNLVSRGVEVEVHWPEPVLRARPATPLPSHIDLSGLPGNVTARRIGGEVRYRTPVLEVGFRLGRPAMSFLAFDPDGLPERPRDLLRHATLFEGDGNDWIPNHPLFGQFALGPQVVTPDGISHIGQFAAVDNGMVRVEGATISYDLAAPSAGQRYELRWTVRPSALELDVVRAGSSVVRAVESSAWHVPFDVRVTPPCLLGRPTKTGEVGSTETPAILHAPGHGSLDITTSGDVTIRCEAARPLMTTALEVKVGERPGELGDHVLAAGRFEGRITFEVTHGDVPQLVDEAPPSVRDGIRRAWLTGLTYRMDTTVLSNNGASIHVASAVDEWAVLASAIGPIDRRTHALDFVRDTLDRYLDEGPGYMAGRTSFHDGLVQDEYVQTDASVLLGLAHLLDCRPDGDWLASRAPAIRALVERTRARDVDGDGLIESVLRTGVSGRSEWSTNAIDVVSFGWKDAYTNALLYDALVQLHRVLTGKTWADLREMLQSWANALKASYMPAFWNPATRWVGGWRSVDGALHDAGFPVVSGTAVCAGLLPADRAREAIEGLWTTLRDAGFDDLRLGLPISVLTIPRGDMIERYAGMLHGFAMPHGFYMNGSASLTIMRPFVAALRQVGMTSVADELIEAAMGTIADGSGFGGCMSGDDLHTWDGTPCGYEGILTYQFGIVAAALERYRRPIDS
jgi:hypothetical protein